MSKATNHLIRGLGIWFVNISFILWILPLGAFIKPDQEARACNGRRAICLCSHLLGKVLAKDMGKTLLRQSGASPQKENGSSSPHFLLTETTRQRSTLSSDHLQTDQILYSFLFNRSIEPVPKATILFV